MPHTRHAQPVARPDSGFALILAILSLVLLTFLGLTMAATTSTELQIAANYRWGQQALYNADAGLEIARRILREQDWESIVPAARGSFELDPTCNTTLAYSAVRCPPTPLLSLRTGPQGEPNRSWENQECDARFYQGYGQVLDTPALAFPLQNVSTMMGRTLNGTFTVWIRRPTKANPDGSREDDTWQDGRKLMITIEGTAPFAGAQAVTARAVANRAVRFVEGQIEQLSGLGCGENRRSQIGLGPLGANYDPCAIVGYQGIGAIAEPGADIQ